jgi:hypothetical protein
VTRLTVTLDIDSEGWAAQYLLTSREASRDIQNYILNALEKMPHRQEMSVLVERVSPG